MVAHKREKSDDSEAAETQTPHPTDVVYSSRDEYFAALQKWIHDAQVWQNSMACMPYFFLSHPELFGIPPLPSSYAADPTRRPAPGPPGPSPTFGWGAQGAPNRIPGNAPGGIPITILG